MNSSWHRKYSALQQGWKTCVPVHDILFPRSYWRDSHWASFSSSVDTSNPIIHLRMFLWIISGTEYNYLDSHRFIWFNVGSLWNAYYLHVYCWWENDPFPTYGIIIGYPVNLSSSLISCCELLTRTTSLLHCREYQRVNQHWAAKHDRNTLQLNN